MAEINEERQQAARLRTMQIMAVALMLGVGTFMAIALYLRHEGRMGPAPAGLLLSWVALGMTGLIVIAQFVLPDRLVAGQLQRIALCSWRPAQPLPPDQSLTDAFALTVVYQTRLIVTLALLEGAAFFCLITYLVEGEFLSVVGAVVCVALMAVRYPTRSGLGQWLEEKQRWLAEERTR